MLTANDCKNAVAMINRAQLTGAEVEEIAALKKKLLEHAAQLEAPQPSGDGEPKPHKPTMPELIDMERSGA